MLESTKAGKEARNMIMDMSTKSVWLPTFGGEHKYLQLWWMLFTAYATVYGFYASIRKTRYPDLPNVEDTIINLATTEGKKQKKENKINVISITNITMACTSGSLIGIVYHAIQTEWPSGQVHMVVDTLLNRYVPQDMVSNIELRRSLNAVSTKK